MILAGLWLLCGARAAQVQRNYWRRRGESDGLAFHGLLVMMVAGPIALIGCWIAYGE